MHTLIIGGSIGGLTAAAALLAKADHKVTVLEAPSEWGGCAEKFKRCHALFPLALHLERSSRKAACSRKTAELYP